MDQKEATVPSDRSSRAAPLDFYQKPVIEADASPKQAARREVRPGVPMSCLPQVITGEMRDKKWHEFEAEGPAVEKALSVTAEAFDTLATLYSVADHYGRDVGAAEKAAKTVEAVRKQMDHVIEGFAGQVDIAQRQVDVALTPETELDPNVAAMVARDIRDASPGDRLAMLVDIATKEELPLIHFLLSPSLPNVLVPREAIQQSQLRKFAEQRFAPEQAKRRDELAGIKSNLEKACEAFYISGEDVCNRLLPTFEEMEASKKRNAALANLRKAL